MNEETSENQTLVSRGKFISGVNYRRKYAVLYVALMYWLRFNSIEHLTKPVNNANEDETFVFPHKNAPLINWKLKKKRKLSMCFKTLSFVTWIYLEHASNALLPPTSLFPLVSNLAAIKRLSTWIFYRLQRMCRWLDTSAVCGFTIYWKEMVTIQSTKSKK